MRFLRALCLTLLTLPLTSCIASRYGREGDVTSGPRTATQSLLAGFQLFNGALEVPPEQVLSDLDEARAGASGDDAKMIDTLKPLLAERLQQRSLSPSDERLVGKLMQQFAKAHPDDFAVQLTVTSGLDQLESSLHSAVNDNPGKTAPGAQATTSGPEGDTAATPSSVKRALDLVGRFPSQSGAHAHLASVLTASGGDQLSAMRGYLRCLQLDPGSNICRSGLQTLASDYTRPRCVAFHKQQFSIQRGYHKAGKGGRVKTKVGRETIYIDPRIAVTGGDINEVLTDAASPQCVITLTPAGALRYGALTKELAAAQEFLVIKAGGAIIAAPRVMSPDDSDQLSVPKTGMDLNKLCETFERRQLPADLTAVVR